MPIYEYQCLDCAWKDKKLGGCDHHTAICSKCSGLMLRLDEDIFWPCLEEVSSNYSISKTST